MQLQQYLDQASDHDRKYYSHLVSQMSSAEQQRFTELVHRCAGAGAKKPLQWAYSELHEDIPQFARFLVLKNLHDLATAIPTNVDMAGDFHPNPDEAFTEIAAAMGAEKLNKFLTAYGMGLVNNFISLLDEGNFESERDKVTWGLFELNEDETVIGRRIAGLHEDIVDFNQ